MKTNMTYQTTRKITVTVVIAERIASITEERNSTWVNILCSRVNENAIVILTVCQKRQDKGIKKSQKGETSRSSPHGWERNNGTRGGRLFHFQMIMEIERSMHNPTILFVRGNIQFWLWTVQISRM
jgi:hypothetical protein